MKNNFFKKVILFVCIVLIVVSAVPYTAYAEKKWNKDGTYYCDIKISAVVPKKFTDKIVLELTDKKTDKKLEVLLDKENQYKRKVTLLGDTEYTTNVIIQNIDNYEVNGLEESYKLTDQGIAIKIRVEEKAVNLQSKEKETEVQKESVQSDDSKINEVDDIKATSDQNQKQDTVLDEMSPKEVLKNFLEKTSFMIDNPDYDNLYSLYSSVSFKNYYLEADPKNTIEKWNELSDHEKYCYYITYILPEATMYGTISVETESEWLENLEITQNYVKLYPRSEEIMDEITKVWKWHWMQWEEKGVFVNLWDSSTYPADIPEEQPVEDTENEEVSNLIDEVEEETGSSVSDLIEEEQGDEEEVYKTVSKEESKKENKFIKILKNNFITLIILAIVGAAFYIIKKKNANKDLDE